MKTAFLITARLKSTRLPKKILLEVAGKPLIVHMLDRLKGAETIEKIIICTSTHPQDDPLEIIAKEEGVCCYRGSENDVLQRLLDAAKNYHLPFFANITADCPLVDPYLVDWAVKEHLRSHANLTMYDDSNNILPFNCYVVKTNSLEKVVNNKTAHDTEVWLKYFLSDNELKIHTIDPGQKYYHSSLKTSVDYPDNYEFMKMVFAELYEENKIFSLWDVIKLVKKNPDILEINAGTLVLKRWRDHQRALFV